MVTSEVKLTKSSGGSSSSEASASNMPDLAKASQVTVLALCPSRRFLSVSQISKTSHDRSHAPQMNRLLWPDANDDAQAGWTSQLSCSSSQR